MTVMIWMIAIDDLDDCHDDLNDCHGDFDNQNELDDKFHPIVLVVQEEHCPLEICSSKKNIVECFEILKRDPLRFAIEFLCHHLDHLLLLQYNFVFVFVTHWYYHLYFVCLLSL